MPYNLLYTRPISSDDRVRFTDVPITSPSIMVDILSTRSPFYRIAGYAYSIVSDGVTDYERGTGYTLPFGKNRLLFPSSPLPYFLEFFPKWGTKQAIISVYVGEPSPAVPSVAIPGTEMRCYRQNSGGRVVVSQNLSSPFLGVGLPPCSEAYVKNDGSIWMDQDAPNFKFAFPPSWAVFATTQTEFMDVRNASSTVRIPSN